MVLTLFLAATVSAYVPGPVNPVIIDPVITPQINPGVLMMPCSCNFGADLPESCMVGDCEGTKTCVESAICLDQPGECPYGMCNLGEGACKAQCEMNHDMCISLCALPFSPPGCDSDCDDSRSECRDDCEESADDCNACDGSWGSCEIVDPCCGVNCEDNEECDGGSCVCADTTERCAADGTGNGVDDDCDGAVDEICTDCVDEDVRPCKDNNNCTGTQECVSGEWEACQKNNLCCGVNCGTNKVCEGSTGNCICKDTEERCRPIGIGDNIDNDCDGTVDEGCMTEQELEELINQSGDESQEPPMVGNDSDEHGCIGSAGYAWCESLGECIRPWETDCPTDDSAPATTLPATTTPPASKPPKTEAASLDLNMVIILLIVVVIVIGALMGIKMMKGKKSAAPQPAQPAQTAQPPQ